MFILHSGGIPLEAVRAVPVVFKQVAVDGHKSVNGVSLLLRFTPAEEALKSRKQNSTQHGSNCPPIHSRPNPARISNISESLN